VLVRLLCPEPSPGLTRTLTGRPGNCRPKVRSWCTEHALNSTPCCTSSARSTGSSWAVSWICPGSTPARRARRASYPLLASMCRPRRLSTRMTAALGQAFMA